MPLEKVNDVWLWVGLGAFTLLAFRTIALSREHVFRLIETHEEPRKGGVWEVTQDTEDAVSATALFELAKGSNSLEIRRAATQILVDRCLHDSATVDSLWQDLASKSSSTRRRARLLATLLVRTGDLNLARACVPQDTPSTFHSADLYGSLGPGAHESILRIPEPPQAPDGGLPVTGRERRTGFPSDPDEQEARRRRREAIVLNEGNRPVTQDDIIQQDISRLSPRAGEGFD